MSADELHVTNELQAIVTGTLLGALTVAPHLAVDVIPPDVDADGNYRPCFAVVGRESGTRLRVEVHVEQAGEPSGAT